MSNDRYINDRASALAYDIMKLIRKPLPETSLAMGVLSPGESEHAWEIARLIRKERIE